MPFGPSSLVLSVCLPTRSSLPDANDNTATPNVDWNQWGGSAQRNNTPVGHNIPTEWEIGEFDYRTGEWDPPGAKNIKWVARLGSQTYGNPVVAGGKVFVGTNNSGGWLKRYPADRRSGLPALLRRQGRQVPLAAQQREAAHRPRPRLAAAGHLLRAARRRRSTVVRHQPRRSPLRRHGRLPRRRKRRPAIKEEANSTRRGRSRRRLGLRHDEGDGRLAAQHGELLAHRRRATCCSSARRTASTSSTTTFPPPRPPASS